MRILLFLLLIFTFSCFGQNNYDDQFPKQIHTPYYKKSVYPYRYKNLWGFCDSTHKIILKTIFEELPRFQKEENYFILTEKINQIDSNTQQLYIAHIYDNNFKLIKSINTSYEYQNFECLVNKTFILNNQIVFDSTFNVVLHTNNYINIADNNDSWPSTKYIYNVVEQDPKSALSNYKLYDNELKLLLNILANNINPWFINNVPIARVVESDTVSYWINLLTKNKIVHKNRSYNFLNEPINAISVRNEDGLYNLYNLNFELINDSAWSIKPIGNYFLIKKPSKTLLIDLTGKTKIDFGDVNIDYNSGNYFCYNKNGLCNVADSLGKFLFSGKYNFNIHPTQLKGFCNMPKKFVTLNKKLAIINSKDSLLHLFNDFEDVVFDYFFIDTLYSLGRTVIRKIINKNKKIEYKEIYQSKIVSVNNIDYTPKNCDLSQVATLQSTSNPMTQNIKHYIAARIKNKVYYLSFKGDTIIPPDYNFSAYSLIKNCVFIEKNRIHYLYNYETRKLSEKGFYDFEWQPEHKNYLISINKQYYVSATIDSSFQITNFPNIQFYKYSIATDYRSIKIAIAENLETKERFLYDINHNKTLCYLDKNDTESQSCFLNWSSENIFSVTVIPGGNTYFFNAKYQLLGKLKPYYYINDSIELPSDINIFENIHCHYFYQFNYKNNEITSVLKTNTLNGKSGYLFKNKHFKKYKNLEFYSIPYFAFTSSDSIYVYDCNDSIVLQTTFGYDISLVRDRFTVSRESNYSNSIYRNNKLIFTQFTDTINKTSNAIELFSDEKFFLISHTIKGESKYGITNYNFDTLIPFNYCYLYSYNKNWGQDSIVFIAQDFKTKKYGLINYRNNQILPFEYDSLLRGIDWFGVFGLYKNNQLYEYNLYSRQLSKFNSNLKRYDNNIKIDQNDNGLFGLKNAYGKTIVKHKYKNIQQEISNDFNCRDLYYTVIEIKLNDGTKKNVKSYFDSSGMEFFKN